MMGNLAYFFKYVNFALKNTGQKRQVILVNDTLQSESLGEYIRNDKMSDTAHVSSIINFSG